MKLDRIKLAKMLLKFGTLSTDKGELLYEGNLEAGLEVFVEDENGEMQPATDGEYQAEDKIYVVAEGKIAEIKEVETEEEKPAEEPVVEVEAVEEVVEEPVVEVDKVAELEAKLEEKDALVKELEAKVAELEAKLAEKDVELMSKQEPLPAQKAIKFATSTISEKEIKDNKMLKHFGLV